MFDLTFADNISARCQWVSAEPVSAVDWNAQMQRDYAAASVGAPAFVMAPPGTTFSPPPGLLGRILSVFRPAPAQPVHTGDAPSGLAWTASFTSDAVVEREFRGALYQSSSVLVFYTGHLGDAGIEATVVRSVGQLRWRDIAKDYEESAS